MHNPAHPGEILKEMYMGPLGVTITQTAAPVPDAGCGESIEVDCQALEGRERAEAQGTFMCSAQDDARRAPRLERFLPPRCAQTPAITRLRSRKAEFGTGVERSLPRDFEYSRNSAVMTGAPGVAADVLAAGVAASIAKNPPSGLKEQTSKVDRPARSWARCAGRRRLCPRPLSTSGFSASSVPPPLKRMPRLHRNEVDLRVKAAGNGARALPPLACLPSLC